MRDLPGGLRRTRENKKNEKAIGSQSDIPIPAASLGMEPPGSSRTRLRRDGKLPLVCGSVKGTNNQVCCIMVDFLAFEKVIDRVVTHT